MGKQPESPKNNLLKGFAVWILLGLMLFLVVKTASTIAESHKTLNYSDFLEEVEKGNIQGTLIVKHGYVYGSLKDGTKFQTYAGDDKDLLSILRENKVSFKVEPASDFWAGLFINIIPVILIVVFFLFLVNRQASSESNKVFSFSRSKPTIPDSKNKITFADVAGSEEEKEELREIIDFLKDPKKFQRLGGKIPKGVLLVGPPGTGKTLLAKAVAGEAGVPFLGMSGSDFVEMFVGVGAARVRDLFRQAKKVAPSIIFIDEIDAVGRQRFAGLGGGHDEREQTLNQLLVEMDGFATDQGIIVIAATNRPDVLDPALTRPGRFDRTIVVSLPDIKEREAILRVHTRNKPLSPSVDLSVISRGTSGLSGADLANIANEAALLAARKGKNQIDMEDFEAAKDKILMGVERRSLVISEEEKKIIAYHEAGHTIVQQSLPEIHPVHKVTIIPHGNALGVTHTLPEKDRFIESDTYFHNTLAALLAGRVTEKIVFGKMFTGSENDLKVATEIARRMVCEWGMSEKLGPVSFREHEAVFLGRDLVQQRTLSEETNREIDNEIKRILEQASRTAEKILQENRDKLDILVNKLLEYETLTTQQINEILGGNNGKESRQQSSD
ncbi:MAG TPA: ATP-dependent zinc metalloprotease FtsH [Candidatus Ratteibacteria bacterium]|uniref:ATP-dependent zinc metalloprotease FtsH n=1 Tax=candidate division TA06 bacterium ADurb.Bin131 TaxID=1852827 RepID=A0A1V6CC38_UNCT6|nr:MAG: ATP-dependent zinc metalloprotease FtsH [candidate division TA06 bacterium ADurb.Bin131]HON05590.1 ATP-dependent zinc metalloprotease FtsH [bacterium]HRS06560.1 ATP-dependent zinc metalloprotease FtsH [Candidatus Ratteibacteria bacterium]HRV04501.1 ATP-dependent zinc metalloprotease FtsH [Candidatus Ratteibacteria bacterium]